MEARLKSFRMRRMVFHMKATLVIPYAVFRDLKKRAVDRNTTTSELATEYLRQGLEGRPKPKRRFRLPSFSAGPAKIDISNREEIYRALSAERHERVYGSAKKG
jgi:hypothetical protein